MRSNGPRTTETCEYGPAAGIDGRLPDSCFHGAIPARGTRGRAPTWRQEGFRPACLAAAEPACEQGRGAGHSGPAIPVRTPGRRVEAR
jgi:hypothetical protein